MASMSIIHDLERRQIDAITAKRARAGVRPRRHREGDGEGHRGRWRPTPRTRRRLPSRRWRTRVPASGLQAYEGVVIARSGGGLNESFTVRKISYGEGVERVFPIHSPYIAEIEVVRRGKVRRAKLYYLRGRRGKSARIFERTDARAKRLNAAFKGFKRPKGEPDDLARIKGVER